MEDKKIQESLSNNNDSSNISGNVDPKLLSDLMKKIDFLTKKS